MRLVVRLHVQMHACMYVHMHDSMYDSMYVCTYVCMYVCAECVYVYVGERVCVCRHGLGVDIPNPRAKDV